MKKNTRIAVGDVIDNFKNVFDAEKSEMMRVGISAVLNITGSGGGAWTVIIDRREIMIQDGEIDNPGVTIAIDSGSFLRITTGALDSTVAFMNGLIRVNGNMSDMMTLKKVVDLKNAANFEDNELHKNKVRL